VPIGSTKSLPATPAAAGERIDAVAEIGGEVAVVAAQVDGVDHGRRILGRGEAECAARVLRVAQLVGRAVVDRREDALAGHLDDDAMALRQPLRCRRGNIDAAQHGNIDLGAAAARIAPRLLDQADAPALVRDRPQIGFAIGLADRPCAEQDAEGLAGQREVDLQTAVAPVVIVLQAAGDPLRIPVLGRQQTHLPPRHRAPAGSTVGAVPGLHLPVVTAARRQRRSRVLDLAVARRGGLVAVPERRCVEILDAGRDAKLVGGLYAVAAGGRQMPGQARPRDVETQRLRRVLHRQRRRHGRNLLCAALHCGAGAAGDADTREQHRTHDCGERR
jgi:hypothetical protein